MAAALGQPLMPWQQDVADVLGEYIVGDDGLVRMHYSAYLMIVPRRAGKTVLTLATMLQRCAAARNRRAFYTAQTRADAAVTFRDEWVPRVRGSVVHRLVDARMSNGSEALTVRPTQSRFRLFAPGPNAIHGSDVDDVCVDEAWAFDVGRGVELEAGIRPAMLTRPAAQFGLISAGGTDASTWLASWQARAQAGARGMFYIEYSADPDVDDLDDPATWARNHPALGHTFGIDDLTADFDLMPRDVFYRSYLSVWTASRGAEPVIPPASWTLAAGVLKPGGSTSLAFAVAPDGAAGAIAAAWLDPSGRLAVEVIDHRPGTAWLASRAAELTARHRAPILADRHGPAAPVVDALTAAGTPVQVVTLDEFATACAALLLDVVELMPVGRAMVPRLVHAGDPVLDAAVGSAGRRPLGERWAWARHGSELSALEAVTLAAHGARTPPPAPPMIR
jgi:hypothetical protein